MPKHDHVNENIDSCYVICDLLGFRLFELGSRPKPDTERSKLGPDQWRLDCIAFLDPPLAVLSVTHVPEYHTTTTTEMGVPFTDGLCSSLETVGLHSVILFDVVFMIFRSWFVICGGRRLFVFCTIVAEQAGILPPLHS